MLLEPESPERLDFAETIIGARAGLAGVLERVEQVAPTDAPALILGETGSGKEVIARAIHVRSRRHAGPLIRVNCGAIPPDLVDSELFGHERGSFTGAVNARRGWFERASGGTLFLDEIGELSLAAQVRLLRVLQDGSLERVGGQERVRVDVRIIAATHRDLAAMVGAGTFRDDLWYRIHVFPIRLPALRDRMADIPALAAHFAARAGERIRGAPLLPTPEDTTLLLSYAWPGNVRELAAVIERAVILGDAQHLDVRGALGLVDGAQPPALSTSSPTAIPSLGAGPFPTLDEAMKLHIERALERTRGRIEGHDGAAQLLGINPHTLRGRMRKLRIDWARFRDAGSDAVP
jgi:transcriptional regulator with GAF, ATPase, and Fis domain